jgi:hypothetical protein
MRWRQCAFIAEAQCRESLTGQFERRQALAAGPNKKSTAAVAGRTGARSSGAGPAHTEKCDFFRAGCYEYPAHGRGLENLFRRSTARLRRDASAGRPLADLVDLANSSAD